MPVFNTPIDLTTKELRNAVVQNLSSDPGTGKVGQIYYNTGSNQLKLCTNATGPVWDVLATGATPDATTGAKGIVQLAGDLGGTGTAAAAPLIGRVSQLVNGLVGTPSVRFAASQGTGMWSSTTDVLDLSAGGVKCLESTSTATTLPLATTVSLALTVTAGGLAVSAGGATIAGTTVVTGALSTAGGSGTFTSAQQLTVSTGGMAVTGNSTVAGSFATTGGSGTITSAQTLTVTTGGLVVSAGGATVTGTTAITGALSTVGASGTATFAQALVVSAGGATITGNSSITGTLNMNSNVINNVTDPTSAQQAATKNYVDTTAQGLSAKPAARVATNAETLTIAAGSVTTIAGTTVDGISVAVNDRIFIANAPAATGAANGPGFANFTTQPGNGLYFVTAVTGNIAISREPEMSGTNGPAGAFVFVEGGTAASSGFTVSTPSTNTGFVYGTNNITWTQFSGAGEISAGTGLAKAGNTLSIENSGVLLPAHGGSGVASPTAHAVLFGAGASAFTNATPTATSGIPLVSNGASSDPSFAALNLAATGAVTNALPIANGGTNATSAAAARTNLATAAVDTATLSSGSTSYTFTPAPAPKTTGAWDVTLVNQSTGAIEYADYVVNQALNTPVTGPANQITVTFASATAVNYTLIAVG